MPVPRLTGAGTLDSMRAGYGSDTLDTFLPQTIGKEPVVTFSRTGDNSVQFIQLLHALDQPELPGWPLMTNVKVTMQKCEKCSREFSSLINYRRHVRVHRRSLNVDKESHKIRDVLAAFWDKLSLDEAKEVASFRYVTLKEIPGSSIVKTLASSLRKPGVWTIPQDYMVAGTILLDIISGKPSRFPISSEELLSILDDASEKTFLCAGMAESLQKYVFDGEAGKIALDIKNVIASAVFLFEQKLVKAWLAEKDTEALRCQKLLVEEEEAAQKRLAKLLERKKQRKLRLKEQQRAKEESNGENFALAINGDSSEVTYPEEASSPQPASDAPELSNDGSSNPDPVQFSNLEEKDVEGRFDFNSDYQSSVIVQGVEAGVVYPDHCRWQMPKSQRVGRNGFHSNQNAQVLKVEATQKLVPAKDRSVVVSSNKVWTKKVKEENVESNLKLSLEEAVNQADGTKSELIIGSMSVLVDNSTSRKREIQFGEQPGNSDNLQHSVNQVSSKLWRPVNREDRKISPPIHRVNHGTGDVQLEKFKDRTASDGSCLQSSESDDMNIQSRDCFSYEESKLPSGLQFSTAAAKAFLSQRWKEAVSAEHVRLEPPAVSEPPGFDQSGNDLSVSSPNLVSVDIPSEEPHLNEGHFSPRSKKSKGRIRNNPEKVVKGKYIARYLRKQERK